MVINNKTSVIIDSEGILHGPEFIPNKEARQVATILLEKMKEYDDRITHVDAHTGVSETFSSFRSRCIGVAVSLRSSGIQPQDVVSILSVNSANVFATAIATLAVGATINVLDPTLKPDQMEHMLDLVKPRVIFTQPSVIPALDEISKTLKKLKEVPIIVYDVMHKQCEDTRYKCFDEFVDRNNNDYAEFKPHEFSNVHEAAALLICSSGTTGLSKGILLSHYSLISDALDSPLTEASHGSGFLFTTLYWISGWYMLLGGLYSGIKRIYTHLPFSEEVAFEIISKYKVNNLLTCPSILNRMVKHPLCPQYDLSCLRRLTIGGGRVDLAQAETFRTKHMSPEKAEIWIVYGITEVGAVSLHKTGERPETEDLSCAGLLRRGFSIKIVDPTTRVILSKAFNTGEILIQSDARLMHYLDNETANKNMYEEGSGQWFKTGDLGHRDRDGRIYITDRVKEMINVNGKLVCPATIETILWKHPLVVECAVIGVNNNMTKFEDQLVAFIQTQPGVKIPEHELIDSVTKHLSPEYHLSGGIVFLDKLPMLPNEKPDRLAVKELAEQKLITTRIS